MPRFTADFLLAVHRALPVQVRTRIPAGLKHRVASYLRGGTVFKTLLDDQLWGGFSQSALEEARTLIETKSVAPGRRRDACQSLAIWHASRSEHVQAIAYLDMAGRLDARYNSSRRTRMLRALFLCHLGKGGEARQVISAELPKVSVDSSVSLMFANTFNGEFGGEQNDDQILAGLNRIFERHALAGVVKKDATLPPAIDNLQGNGVALVQSPTRVSIIVPVYNGADTISTALDSLANQSWQNIEVLVVDDASTDRTTDIVAEFCAKDQRFRLLQRSSNSGSYVSRNHALSEATGDYVTIHDADDWAHPDRIRFQVEDLLKHRKSYNLTNWVRTTPSLFFMGPWRPDGRLISLNMGSLMFARNLSEQFGGWSEARVSADREFLKRLELILGATERSALIPDCPMVLGRSTPTSLTRTGATSVATSHHGVRREYHEAADYWHSVAGAADAKCIRKMASDINRTTPASIRPDRRVPEFDVLLFADWNFKGGTAQSAYNMALAAKANGLSVGFFHYPRYDIDVFKAIRPDLRTFAYSNGFSFLAAGERARAGTVVVTYPPIFEHLMDRFPEIEHERLVVVVNQMAERDTTGLDKAYDPATVRRNLLASFGGEGDWVPISNRVRKLMEGDPRYPQPHQDTWTPLVEAGAWMQGSSVWRGNERTRPVIGRHGRDHILKWPGSAEAIRDAYCANQDCEVRFLGGADHARTKLGRWPSNWRVEKFNSRDVKTFLSELDFFLHYPHENYIEEFGRAPMEAMAIGVPVILPPIFEDTFGKAALYAEPDEVWPIIQDLWKDRDAWQQRVDYGRAFVLNNCSYDAFPRRVPEARRGELSAYVS